MALKLSDEESGRILHKMFSQRGLGESISRLGVAIANLAANRHLLVTSKGFIGLGSPEVQEGDQVFVLKGGSPPFLLRPVTAMQRASYHLSPASHTIVGPAYVHGIMYGEAVHEDTKWQDVFLV